MSISLAEARRWAEKAFGPEGALAAELPGFEHRAQQVEMAARVWLAFSTGRVALIEAGTGTGKSLAYLYPGLLHARRAGGPLIVSTNTINLQEQLLQKDLPILAAICREKPPKTALLLGRGNYLCRRRLDHALRHGTLDLPLEVMEGLLGAVRRGLGERNKLGVNVPEESWQHLASDGEFCLRPRCPRSEDCFWLAARRAAAEAEIVLVNHHLLLADVAIRQHLGWEAEQAVLPAYRRVVFDEAHHLEDIATEHFSLRLSSAWFTRLLDRLHLREGPGSQGELTHFLFGVRTSGNLAPERLAAARELAAAAVEAVERVKARAGFVFGPLQSLAREGNREGSTWQRRYTSDLRDLDPSLGPAAEDLLLSIRDLDGLLEKLLAVWEGENAETPETEEGMAIRYIRGELSAYGRNLPLVLAGESREHVYWLEASRHRTGAEVEAIMAPLHVGPLFYEWLVANLESAVFTSATLTVGSDFGYFRERLGLDRVAPGERIELALASPFDYRRQVLLAAAGDLPDPDDPRFPEAAASFLAALLRITRGRTLILFTSFTTLDLVCDLLEPKLPAGLKLMRQGEAPRGELIAAFQSGDGIVLCGTDSFWEGVDVPGLALSCVVLARLPFRVPTEPVVAARMELVEREGGSSFQRYSLPQAVIKLKQGFGRLVRRGDDGGAVVILDRRFLTRNYGRIFREALPRCAECFGRGEEVIEAVDEWLKRLESRAGAGDFVDQSSRRKP